MPSNKTLVTFIICIGLVISVYLFERNPTSTSVAVENPNVIAVNPPANINTNDDWKKLLVSVSPENQNVTDLTNSSSTVFDETTLTAQMSKDFFSQYLLAKEGGRALTQSDINTITNNVLSSPQYFARNDAVYISSNLHITEKTDKDTVKKYKDTINVILKNRSTQIKDNPVMIMSSTMKSGEANELPKLNSIISVGKGFVSDFLKMDVPKDAVVPHLGLLNSVNNVVSDLESMREIYTDPVKGMAGVGRYNNDIINFQTALKNVNAYFDQKGV